MKYLKSRENSKRPCKLNVVKHDQNLLKLKKQGSSPSKTTIRISCSDQELQKRISFFNSNEYELSVRVECLNINYYISTFLYIHQLHVWHYL